ncbi:MAG: SusC/RagA family TonB-linked outer membrane protein [Bacteroidota bacterium]
MRMKLNYYCKQVSLRISTVLMGILLMSTMALAQRSVTGTVTDAGSGDAIPGVAVLIKGTTVGAYTDENGQYSLSAPSEATVLVFSYYGYETMEKDISGLDVVDAALAESVGTLDEVVVTGYTTQREEEKTSAIVSVRSDDFNQGNINNPAQLIQGKVAGVTISRPGGNPNQEFNIRLRGLGTIGANRSPLVIIDGVLNADINTVDPNDIASFDILKDASAAAIYGTQAASGVIIITTKKGVPGSTSVDYNGFVTIDYIDQTTEVLGRDEFLSFPGTQDFGSDTDWIGELTRTGNTQVHNVSMSGGSNSTTYRASVNFRDVEGIALKTGFEQLNGRLNLQQKAINDKLTINLNITTTLRNSELGNNGAFRYATIYNPTAPVRSDAPEFERWGGYFQQDLFDFFNPVALLEQNTNEGNFTRVLGDVNAKFEVVPGLILSGRYSQQRTNEIFANYTSKQSRGTGADRNGLASRNTNQFVNQLAEISVSYETEFGDLDFSVLGGYSYQQFDNEGFGAQGGDFLTDAFSFNNLSAGADFNNGLGSIFSYANRNKLIAGFGRVELGYQDTYYLSAVVRQEGSTRFGEDNKWGTFPGFSAGIILSNLFEVPGIDYLKIRGGYGETGAQPAASYLSLFTLAPGGNFFFNGAFTPAYGPNQNPNPDLRWETKQDVSIGLDFNMLNYRLNGSIDYFNTTTVDAILPLNVPVPPNQAPITFTNIGEISQSGLEISLGYKIFDNANFSWESSVAFTYLIDNTLDVFNGEGTVFRSNLGSPGQNGTPLLLIEEGKPIGQLYGLVFEGIAADGTWIHKDSDGDGTPGEDEDREVIGQALNDWQLGWNNTFRFGDFDVNFLLRGVFGHDLINTFRAFYEAPSSMTTYNAPATVTDVRNLTDAPIFSSYHVEDGDFIKLDNITFGYTVPVDGIDWMKRLRVYVTGQNLFTITDYSGVDPEVRLEDNPNNAGIGDPLAPGIDRRNTYFRQAGVTFGVNLGL